MTNTLHRYGSERSLQEDYIVFAIPCRGYNDQNCAPKLLEFLERSLKYKPVNLGDATKGSAFRPSKQLTPTAHWKRNEPLRFEEVVRGVSGATTAAAVFDNKSAAERFIRELREADLGLSINLSALVNEAKDCCRSADLVRHSVEYSLPFMGATEHLAEMKVLELTMMCGHGMISFNFARKMIDWVKAGRRTPRQACEYMCRFCTCGIFNPSRATRILEEIKKGN